MLLLTLAMPAAPAQAEDDDAFSATVKVDATAEDAVKARELARLDGQRRALQAVIERAAAGADPAKLAKLDDRAITDMVASFEVANERMSAVRYLADYTFHFRPGEVRRLLRSAGAGFAENAGKPVIVLPVYQVGTRTTLWDDPNRWRQAWAQRPAGTGPLRLVVPIGDAGDLAAIDAAQALAGDADALNAIAHKSGADEVVVVVATARLQDSQLVAVDVDAKRYRLGQSVDSQSKSFDAKPDESKDDFLHRVVDAAAPDIASGWKKNNVLRYDQQGSLTAVVAIASLEDWIQIRNRLAGLPAIRKIELMSLTRQEATIEIQYVGSIDQLKTAVSAISFDLGRGDPGWRLAPSGATPSR